MPNRMHSSNILNPDISYLRLRSLIGTLGILLPILVWVFAFIGGEDIAEVDTISEHYYTTSRDLLVITLSSVGMLIFFYRTEYWQDSLMAKIAGISAIGIGIFPMAPDWSSWVFMECWSQINCSPTLLPLSYEFPRLEFAGRTLVQGMHGVSLVFFVIAGLYLVFISFPRTSVRKTLEVNSGSASAGDSITLTPQKILRNRIIRGLGASMAIGIFVFSVSSILFKEVNPRLYHYLRFGFESLFVVSFAAAWLIKGQVTPFSCLNKLIQDPELPRYRRVKQLRRSTDNRMPHISPDPLPVPPEK